MGAGRERSVTAAFGLALLGLHGCAEGNPQPNLVLIAIDTLRADHLGAYGYRTRGRTPASIVIGANER